MMTHCIRLRWIRFTEFGFDAPKKVVFEPFVRSLIIFLWPIIYWHGCPDRSWYFGPARVPNWCLRASFNFYWTKVSKTEMESLIRLWHIFSRKFESIIISISLFCFASDGKQFCSIKIISLSGISTGVSRTRNHETRLRLVFDLHWSKTSLETPVLNRNYLNPFPLEGTALFDCILFQHLLQIERYQHLDAF